MAISGKQILTALGLAGGAYVVYRLAQPTAVDAALQQQAPKPELGPDYITAANEAWAKREISRDEYEQLVPIMADERRHRAEEISYLNREELAAGLRIGEISTEEYNIAMRNLEEA